MEWMDRPRLIGGLGWVAVGVVLQAVYWFTGGAAGGITVLLVGVSVLAAAGMLRAATPRLRWWSGRIVGAVLGADFLAAVADRFGLFGAPGAPAVSWGDWQHFVDYTAGMLPNWAAAAASTLAVGATVAEIVLGALLLAGPYWRWAGKLAAGLLALYLVAMSYGYGWAAPLQYAVPVLIGAALLTSARAGRSGNRPPSGRASDGAAPHTSMVSTSTRRS